MTSTPMAPAIARQARKQADQEAFSTTLIGLLGTAYFGGFVIGCFFGADFAARFGFFAAAFLAAFFLGAGCSGPGVSVSAPVGGSTPTAADSRRRERAPLLRPTRAANTMNVYLRAVLLRAHTEHRCVRVGSVEALVHC